MSDNYIKIGRINGNALCGLCERVCVEAKLVTDGCKSVYQNEQTEVPLSNFSSSATPISFESLYANGVATISGLSITDASDGRSRIRYNATIPATVYLLDENGNTITARGELSFYQDVLLTVPSQSPFSFSVEVAIVARSRVGRLVSANLASVRLCAIIYTRIIQRREIVIPTYGDSVYPNCRGFEQNCSGVDEPPVFNLDELS